jgi:tetratricopeptide (TPR) repeat protein
MAVKGEIELAKETVAGIDSYGTRADVKTQIADAFLAEKRKDAAVEWLELADSETGEPDTPEELIRILIQIGNGFFDIGQPAKGAVKFANAAEHAAKLESTRRDGFLVEASTGLLKCGEVEAADEVLDKIEDKAEIARCLYGFSRALQLEDEIEEAADAIEEAFAMLKSQTEYEIRDTAARNRMFATVAIQFQRVGQTDKAIIIANENQDGTRRNEALTSIAQLLLMDGNTDLAESVLEGVRPESEKAMAFVGLSDAANTIDNKEAALENVNRAKEVLGEITQHIVRADVSDEIALRLSAYGDNEGAVQMARDNINLIAEIRDDGGQSAALLRLASVYNKLGIEPASAELDVLDTIVRKIGL